jgi:3-methyladenine DNA glycosylase AlkD
MSFDIQPLIRSLETNQNPENARAMEQYMRNQFPFFGIKATERRLLVREFVTTYGLPQINQIPDVVTTLWNHPKRECQSAALDLLVRSKKRVSAEHMPLVEWMILTKSWWDTVDVIAPQCCGTLFQQEPPLIDHYAEKWIISGNFWLRRAALLFQLKYKNTTDEQRLFHYILLNTDSDEFFIQKAIGWALREYSKTAPDAVKQFIKEHDELKSLSRREGMKWLNRP